MLHILICVKISNNTHHILNDSKVLTQTVHILTCFSGVLAQKVTFLIMMVATTETCYNMDWFGTLESWVCCILLENIQTNKNNPVHFIVIFLHGLVRLTCSGIDALPSFRRAYTISSSTRRVVEGVFWKSGVVHSFKMVDTVLFVFEFHVLYFRDL